DWKSTTKVVIKNNSAEDVSDISLSADILNGRFVESNSIYSIGPFDIKAGEEWSLDLNYTADLNDKEELIAETKDKDENFVSILKQPIISLNVTACERSKEIEHKTNTVYGVLAVYNNYSGEGDSKSLGGLIVNFGSNVEGLKEEFSKYEIEGEGLKKIESDVNKCGDTQYCKGKDSFRNSVFNIYSTQKLKDSKDSLDFNEGDFLLYNFFYTHTDIALGSDVKYDMFFAPMIKPNDGSCKTYSSNGFCDNGNFVDRSDFGCDAVKADDMWWCDDIISDLAFFELNEFTPVKTISINNFDNKGTIIEQETGASVFQEETGSCSPNINDFCIDLKYWKKNEIVAKELETHVSDSGSVPNIYNFKTFADEKGLTGKGWTNSDCNASYIKEMGEWHVGDN
ncbi:MAG: hypothetical protein KAS30_02870, partial [Candidatus Diapherotrites archaeon]|nr:hypothetical protein [Candidatus Diapherotrites archaeon]